MPLQRFYKCDKSIQLVQLRLQHGIQGTGFVTAEMYRFPQLGLYRRQDFGQLAHRVCHPPPKVIRLMPGASLYFSPAARLNETSR
jgi:hypothetical protein